MRAAQRGGFCVEHEGDQCWALGRCRKQRIEMGRRGKCDPMRNPLKSESKKKIEDHSVKGASTLELAGISREKEVLTVRVRLCRYSKCESCVRCSLYGEGEGDFGRERGSTLPVFYYGRLIEVKGRGQVEGVEGPRPPSCLTTKKVQAGGLIFRA